MNKAIKYIVLAIVAVLGFASQTMAHTQDSVGTKVKNGKIFIMHKVEKGEGLFSISRKYGVALNDIIKENPGAEKVLYADQIILIPTGKDAPMEDKAVKEYFKEDKDKPKMEPLKSKSTFASYHVVEKGETLYSIAVKYKTKVDVLKSLNGLKSDNLSVGQRLMVPSQSDQKEKVEEVVDDKKSSKDSKKARKSKKRIDPNTEKVEKVPVKPITTDAYQIKIEKLEKYNVEKIAEKGTVGDWAGSEYHESSKRVCSHHLAEVGSTIMVTNPSNNKTVFVKVVDNHQLDESTGNIIKLSKQALTDVNLQAGERVEISFAR